MGVSLECNIINMFIFLNFSFYGVWGKGTLKKTTTNNMYLSATFFFFLSFIQLPSCAFSLGLSLKFRDQTPGPGTFSFAVGTHTCRVTRQDSGPSRIRMTRLTPARPSPSRGRNVRLPGQRLEAREMPASGY